MPDDHNRPVTVTAPATAAATVRPARTADAPAIAAILAEALAAKYRPALGRSAADALAGLVRDEIAAGATGFLVAELDGEPVAVAHLATGESPQLHGVGRRLGERIGVWRAVRAIMVLSLLRHDPVAADEGHIGEVGVLPELRRQGLARLLLTEIERRARALGKRRLTLWVTGENTPAITLYEREGFRVVRRRRWTLGRLVFRAAGIQLMEKPLGVRG